MPIIVRPIEAVLNHDTDFLSIDRMDPYCYITLGGERKRTMTCHEGGRHPRWGDTFMFNNMSGDMMLKIEIWDKDTFSPDDLVGSGNLNLMQVMNTGMPINQYVELFYKGRNAGNILIYVEMQGMGMGMGMGGMGMGMPMNGMGMGGMGMGMNGGMGMGGMGMPMNGMGMGMGGMGMGGMGMGGMGMGGMGMGGMGMGGMGGNGWNPNYRGPY